MNVCMNVCMRMLVGMRESKRLCSVFVGCGEGVVVTQSVRVSYPDRHIKSNHRDVVKNYHNKDI